MTKIRLFFNQSEAYYNTLLNRLLVVFAFTFPINHYANSTIFFFIAIIYIVRGNYANGVRKIFNNKIVLIFILFVFMHYVWLIGTDNLNQAKFLIGKMKYGLYIIIFISFIEKEYYSKVITGFIFGIFLSEIVSYAIFFNIIPSQLFFYNEAIYNSNPSDPTPFTNHIYYAIFLSFATSLVLYKILKLKTLTKEKMIYIVFFATITINMFLQASRTGYILYILMIGFTLIYIYRLKSIKIITIITPILFATLLIFYSLSNTFKERFNETINSVESIYKTQDFDSSLGKRIGIYKYGVEAISDNWLIGVGTGDIMDETFSYVQNSQDKHLLEMTTLHNEFLNAFLRFGIIGPLILIYLFYIIFTFKQENDYLNFILKSSSFIVIISMLPEDFFQGWMIIFWIITLSTSSINTRNNVNLITSRYTKDEIKFYFIIFIVSYISAFAKTFKYWGT